MGNKDLCNVDESATERLIKGEEHLKEIFEFGFSKDLSKRIKKAKFYKLVYHGIDYSTQPVLGLDSVVGQKGVYTINPKEASIVNNIYNAFISYNGNLRRLKSHCERFRFVTKKQSYKKSKASKQKKIGGKKFTVSSLVRLLRNPKIHGFGITHDEDGNEYFYRYQHKGVVPEAIARKVLEILNCNKDKSLLGGSNE